MKQYKMWFDGGIDFVNKRITCGFVIKENDKIIKKHSSAHSCSKITNNIAEYTAILLGLKWFITNNINGCKINIFGDSKLVINQLNGSYKIRSKTSQIFVPAVESILIKLQDKKCNINLNWVRRHRNQHADELSNQAKFLNNPYKSSI